MLSQITFTLQDFGMLLLWAGLTVAAWYLVFVLYRLYKIIRLVQDTLDKNREAIDSTIKEVPLITRNVQEITTEVAHSAQVFRPTVENIAETSDSVTGTIKDNQNITETIVSFFNVLNTVKKAFDKLNQSVHKE